MTRSLYVVCLLCLLTGLATPLPAAEPKPLVDFAELPDITVRKSSRLSGEFEPTDPGDDCKPRLREKKAFRLRRKAESSPRYQRCRLAKACPEPDLR